MPSEARCAPRRSAGCANSLHEWPLPNSGSSTLPAWQYGKPKFSPSLSTRFKVSSGMSSPSRSRPLLVNQNACVPGCQSKPTELRMPVATVCQSLPSAFIRMIFANPGPGLQMLHGAPIGTYSLPSGPNAMNFQPWCVLVGSLSVTTTGFGGSARCASMSGYFKILLTADTYNAPSWKATPTGISRSFAITYTCCARPFLSMPVSAYTLPSRIEPTNTVLRVPSVISRAFGTWSLKIETWKPGGTFRLCSGAAAEAEPAKPASPAERSNAARNDRDMTVLRTGTIELSLNLVMGKRTPQPSSAANASDNTSR